MWRSKSVVLLGLPCTVHSRLTLEKIDLERREVACKEPLEVEASALDQAARCLFSGLRFDDVLGAVQANPRFLLDHGVELHGIPDSSSHMVVWNIGLKFMPRFSNNALEVCTAPRFEH